MDDPISRNESGKYYLPDREGKFQPNFGEKWLYKVKEEKENNIILSLIKKC